MLEAGSTLGHYEILSSLGAGGMGEVYRARDTKLGREVALKLLLEEVSADPERLARFEREARVLASLNHPNVATLYGFEREADTSFLVMELVEGETLAERIGRSPIPADEAIGLFVQIAEGLEAAHEQGVIHRDLKPANIKLSPEGQIKVLDFGLAKALVTEDEDRANFSESPTLTLAATRRGEILGTAAYMSPEQAAGKTVDRRADLWAFGVCLYEALTGQRAFQAEDAANTLASVLRDEPDLDELPSATPMSAKRLLSLCLAKNPRHRLRDASDARLILLEPQEAMTEAAVPSRSRSLPAAALGFATAVALAIALWVGLRPSETPPPRLHIDVRIAETGGNQLARDIALSNDGKQMAYVLTADAAGDNDLLYVRTLESLEGRVLATGAVFHPFFSPDGSWVAYFTSVALMKVPTGGGTPIELAPAEPASNGSWAADGTIVFKGVLSTGGLARVSAAGGEPEALTEVVLGQGIHLSPQVLPGGRSILFTSFSTWWGTHDPLSRPSIQILDLETRDTKTVLANGAHARYLPTGHLVFLDGGSLFAIPFDLDSEATGGTPAPLAIDVFATPVNEHPGFSASESGQLLYLAGSGAAPNTALWVDRDATTAPLLDPGFYAGPRLSPDGNRLTVAELRDGNVDIRIYDLASGTDVKLTFDDAQDDDPIWSRDGRHILFNSSRDGADGIYRVAADGSEGVEPMIVREAADGSLYPSSEGPNGELAYGFYSTESSDDILVLEPDGSSTMLVETMSRDSLPQFSPDGRWIAYSTIESGAWEVFVTPYPPGPGRQQVSSGGGTDVKWSGDGHELYYAAPSGILVVPVEYTARGIRLGTPEVLLEGSGYRAGSHVAGEPYPAFDPSPDGQGFVVIQSPPGSWGNDHVRLVTGWFAELERLAPSLPGT